MRSLTVIVRCWSGRRFSVCSCSKLAGVQSSRRNGERGIDMEKSLDLGIQGCYPLTAGFKGPAPIEDFPGAKDSRWYMVPGKSEWELVWRV